MPGKSAAFFTPLLMFFDVFQAAIAVRMVLANLVMVCAVLAVAATAPAPNVTREAATTMTAVAASSTARSSRMPVN